MVKLSDRVSNAIKPKPMCRDCADFGPRCPNTNELCDPTQKAKEVAAEVEQLQQDRDALAAYCEELKDCVKALAEMCHDYNFAYCNKPSEMYKECCTAIKSEEEVLNKSPQTCLAEHDARVVEAVANALFKDKHDCYDDDVVFIEKYAQQLRGKAK